MKSVAPLTVIGVSLLILGIVGARVFVSVQEARTQAPWERPEQGAYYLRHLNLVDKPGVGVWVVAYGGWTAYSSLGSPDIRAWVSRLPRGTIINLEADRAAPAGVGQSERAELSDFANFCASYGVRLVSLPVA